MEQQKALNRKSYLKKEQSWRHHPSWLQATLQSCGNQLGDGNGIQTDPYPSGTELRAQKYTRA